MKERLVHLLALRTRCQHSRVRSRSSAFKHILFSLSYAFSCLSVREKVRWAGESVACVPRASKLISRLSPRRPSPQHLPWLRPGVGPESPPAHTARGETRARRLYLYGNRGPPPDNNVFSRSAHTSSGASVPQLPIEAVSSLSSGGGLSYSHRLPAFQIGK